MAINPRIWMRRSHRWGAVLVALPFLLVIVTGVLLQVKKDLHWVQPPTMRGTGNRPAISFEVLLSAAQSVSEAGVKSWADVARVDVQPGRGIAKIHAISHWEVQVDLQTGEVLQTAYRRSDLIESLHDGSWFHPAVKLWVFLPVGLIVLGLWITGVYLFFLPWAVKRSRRRLSPNPPPQRSVLGRSVVIGSATLALIGALTPQPSDLNWVTGAIFGFMLGAAAGVVLDRRRKLE